MTEVVIGIDVGGTNSGFGLVNGAGEVLGGKSLLTRNYLGADAFFEGITESIDDLIGEFQGNLILRGIGIGAPNGNFYNGTVDYAPNLNWEGIVPLAKMFRERYRVPVVLTNDANAAAMGEMLFGGAVGMKNFILTTIGTGLGSGIVVNGNLVHGHTGFAGELGHTTVVRKGRVCTCGRSGCLEAYVSARGMVQTAKELIQVSPNGSQLKYINTEQFTPELLTRAAREGDSVALRTFEETGRILGEQLAEFVAILSPETLFIAGGIAQAGNLLLEPARQALNASLLNVFQNRVELVNSKLIGKQPAIRGAAAMIWKDIQPDHEKEVIPLRKTGS